MSWGDFPLATIQYLYIYLYSVFGETGWLRVVCQVLSVTASVCTSTVIAIDRYLVVTQPLKPRASRRARLIGIWVVVVALSSVQLAVGRSNTVEVRNNNNNNNNNNNQDSVYDAVIMTQSHCESSPGSRDECRTAPDGCRPLHKADGLEP